MVSILNKDSLGYFDLDKKEYVITNMFPVRPQINLLWNNTTVSKIDHFGCGDTFIWDGKFRRFIESGKRIIYIKDEENGLIYSPNRNFNNLKFEMYKSHVGQGYSLIESIYDGIYVEFTIVVPTDEEGICYQIKVKNTSNRRRTLSLYFADELFCNLTGHNSAGKGVKDDKYGGLYFPHDGYADEHLTDLTHLYFASDKKYDSYAVCLSDIIGSYGGYTNPEGVKERYLSSKPSVYENQYTSCFQFDVVLEPNEEEVYNFGLTVKADFDVAAKSAIDLASHDKFNQRLIDASNVEADMLDRYVADIPDKYVENLINVWLKHQVSFGKSWGRIYFKGFRDVMQDVTSFAAFSPEAAKRRILISLSYQFKNGNAVRGYDPVSLIPNNDSAAWIPDAVCTYIKETGDFKILDEVLPYYDGGEDTVFNHIYKGMIYLTTDVGKCGLTLFRQSDWNDSTNGAGRLGRGESVWLSEATVRALKIFAELCKTINKPSVEAEMLELADKMTQNVMKYGFIDGRFIHGYDDFDNIVGGGDINDEGAFCLNMQTWAVLSGVCNDDIKKSIMDRVEKELKCPFGYVLNNPPYTKPKAGVGRTSYFMPGAFENASVYIHGSMFKAVADCLLNRGDNAYETVTKVLYPNNPNSGEEPFAVSNMLLGPSSIAKAQEAPHSWITGSAGWMYRALTEFILGVQADYNGLRVIPCPPSSWDGYKVSRIFRGTTYNITFIKSDTSKVMVDGKDIEGNQIPLSMNKTCDVNVYYIVK